MNVELQEQTDIVVRSIELLRDDLRDMALAVYVLCALVCAILLVIAIRNGKQKGGKDDSRKGL